MNVELVVAGHIFGMCTPSLSSTHTCAPVRRRACPFREGRFLRLPIHKLIYNNLNVIDVTHL